MEDKKNSKFSPGVVEAYYGRTWDAEDREACLSIYPDLGIKNYIYAPKSDKRLRSEWKLLWEPQEFDQLVTLFAKARSSDLQAGVGLSPLGLADISESGNRDALRAKIEQINELEGSWLGVFFDDMPSSGKAMAANQLDIVEFIAGLSNASRLIICPSYYTTDKLLEDLFGERPTGYWKELGCNLPDNVDFFWTGEKVCSTTYCRDNIEFIAEELRRLPVLWDNYPVNDGAKSSRYLNIKPFSQRPAWLENYTAGHFSNPMNQPYLSLLPLATLSSCYGASDEQLKKCWEVMARRLSPELSEQLWQDARVFQEQGLDVLEASDWQQEYARYVNSDAVLAREITDWMAGGYTFDPACLTG